MSNQNVQDIYPLSPAQQSMLLYLVLSGYRSEVYFDQYVATLGPLDPVALRRAWQQTVDRHSVLRTLFLWEKRDQPLQVVRRQVELPWQEHDWSHLPEAEREARLKAFLSEDHALGFDLGKAPLMRVAVIRWDDGIWKMVWSFSHLILDGWSIAVVLSEVTACYSAAVEGRQPELPPAQPFRDYIGWLKRQDPARAEDYWRRVLARFEPPTPIPFDGTGGEEQHEWKAAEVDRLLTPETVRGMQALVRRHQITPNTLLQGLWGLLLGRWGALDDVLYGVIVSGRPFELESVESMVGMFINGLPLRLKLDSGAELIPWLRTLQAEGFEQRDFEYCSMEQILVWAGMPRSTPLFESVLVYENYPSDPLGRSGGLGIREAQLREAGNFPLTLYVGQRGEGMSLRLSYHWERFSAAAAERLVSGVETLLLAALERPESRLGDLTLLRPEERQELISGAAGPVTGRALVPVHRRFQEQAARTPGAVALVSASETLSYGDLERASRRLASRLRGLGVGPESIVGLCAERSAEMIVGMLAILEAGGAYLPLDSTYPPERLAYMLEDSGARVLLTQEQLLSRLPAHRAEVVLLDGSAVPGGTADVPATDVDVSGLAYVIYTSGSTGRPKGVLVPHSTLAHYVDGAARAFEIRPEDRVLQFASISFDTSAEEIYPCLTRGATLVLRDDEMVASLDRFAREVGARGITVLDLPTAYWHEIVAEMEQGLEMPTSLRLVILGGEQAQRDRLRAWRERVGDRIRLVNTYGPTEATIVSTRRELTGQAAEDFSGDVPIGRPIDGARAYVVDPGQELLPSGLDGELLIGGGGITRGYLGRPELTAERFVPDPYSEEPGARLYRTGDLVRLLGGSDLQFRGRTDHQVKIRGYRIELGEIEAALRAVPAVHDAVVVAGEASGGGRRLVAWVVPREGAQPALGELRAALKEGLPEYMIPSVFALIEELPRTPGGKVDRRAVSRMEGEEGRLDLGGDLAAPRNQVEEMLVEMWGDLLGVERVGVHDDFFQLGGHSLLVAKLASRVRQAFQVELPMVEVFKKPTVADLAEAIQRAERAGNAPEMPPIRRAPRDRPIPLSFPQERVWFLDQLSQGGNIAYNFQVTIWFRGLLDVGALHRTLDEIVRRHEVLRTSFPALDDRPVQVIHPPAPVDLPVIDLRGVPIEERRALSERLLAEATQVPFDVARLPLVRWRLLRLEDDLHELIQVEHHFVHDGWSFSVMLREIKAIYTAFAAGEPSPLPELPVQYADFAAWQRSWMEGEAMEHLLAYWRGKLEGSTTSLELPTDRPRPTRPSFAGELHLSRIDPELYEELRVFSRREGFTLYMTMLAGFFMLLQRYTAQDDILVGTSNANRTMREIEGMIGMVVNSLVLRGDLAGDPTCRELLARVRELTLGVYAHQHMPLERLVQELRPERQASRNPLFQVMFNFHDAGVPDLDFAGLSAKFLVRGNRSAKMDLNVIVIPRAEQRVGLEASEADRSAVLHWEYNTDLFDASTMERMIGHYLTLLGGMARNPGQRLSELPLLSEAESVQLLQEWSRTGDVPAGENCCLHQLFEAQVERDPGAVALVCGRERITYDDLNRRANRLAHRLRSLGVGPEVLVGVFLDRSADLLASLLAVLKAGGAYVPLDPEYPQERVALMLEDSGVPVLITRSTLEEALPGHGARVVRVDSPLDEPDQNPESGVQPGNLAYMIYTSGSTGRPKAVALEHRGDVAFARWAREAFSPAELAGVLAATSVCFDLSVFELFVPLAWGGTVILAANALELPNLPAVGEVTLVNTVPSAMAELVRMRALPPSLLTVNLAGEPLRSSLVQEIYATSSVDRVLNLYGPSEDTTYSTYTVARRGADAEPSIGRPLPGTQAYLVDPFFQTVPKGIPGELVLGGVGLGRGYFRRPELTAERFVPNPWSDTPGGRLYRTGDLARFRHDREIDYLGRIDHQVKVRGFRIELGEIEVALAKVPGVREAVVVVRGDGADRRLVAYLVGEGETVPGARELREILSRHLPTFMVPGDFVVLERLPLTPSGKVNRRALPAPGQVRPEDAVEHVAPRTPVEETLASIWAEVLGLERVGVRDDFFVLGGHSLSAARVLARVRGRLHVELPLSIIFERRSIERMADLIAERQGEPALALEPVLAGGDVDGIMARAAALSDADLDALLGEMMEGEAR